MFLNNCEAEPKSHGILLGDQVAWTELLQSLVIVVNSLNLANLVVQVKLHRQLCFNQMAEMFLSQQIDKGRNGW